MSALHKEFQKEFGDEAGLDAIDFRPHFDGDLVNVHRVVPLMSDRRLQVSLVWSYVRVMAEWIVKRRSRFHAGDRFQLVVGWPEDVRKTGRQIVKLGGGFDELVLIATTETCTAYESFSRRPIFLSGWDRSLF